MNDPQLNKEIGQLIKESLKAYHHHPKLPELEDFYQDQGISYHEEISQQGKSLTKRIYGTNVKCIKQLDLQGLPLAANLKAFAYVFLFNCFSDIHVMQLLVEEINQSKQTCESFVNFPYSKFGVSTKNFTELCVEVLKKLKDWCRTFQIMDILSNYYVAVDIFSLLLQSILIKLRYKNAEECHKRLERTGDIFAILSDYFDISMTERGYGNIARKKQSNQQSVTNLETKIYFFNEIQLFISTSDNIQFCVGRYYENQDDFFRAEKTVRKSTLEYILNKKDQKEEEKPKLRISQMEVDLGMSSSGFVFPAQNQDESPYGNSNAPTPQFGNLMDSFKFQRSQELNEGAFGYTEKKVRELKTVEEELEQSGVHTNKNKSISLNVHEKESYLFGEENQFNLNLSKYQSNLWEGEKEDTERNRIPKSPASREKDDERISGYHNRQISVVTSQLENSLNFEQMGKVRKLNGYKQCESQRDNETEEIKNRKYREIKRMEEGSKTQIPKDYSESHEAISSFRIQKKSHVNDLTKDNHSPRTRKQHSPSRKDRGDRKYSMNYQISDRKQLKVHGQRNIYNSNHLDMEKMTKSFKKKEESVYDRNENILSEVSATSSAQRKMGFASNIVNIKMEGKNSEKDCKEINEIKEKTPQLEASSEYLVISKEPGQGGFKKKKSEEEFMNLGNFTKLSPTQTSPLNSKRNHFNKRESIQKSKAQYENNHDSLHPKKTNDYEKEVPETPLQKKSSISSNSKIYLKSIDKEGSQKNIYLSGNKWLKNGQKFFSPQASKKFPQFLRQKNLVSKFPVKMMTPEAGNKNDDKVFSGMSKKKSSFMASSKNNNFDERSQKNDFQFSKKDIHRNSDFKKSQVDSRKKLEKTKNTHSNPQLGLTCKPANQFYDQSSMTFLRANAVPSQYYSPNHKDSLLGREPQQVIIRQEPPSMLSKMKEPLRVALPESINNYRFYEQKIVRHQTQNPPGNSLKFIHEPFLAQNLSDPRIATARKAQNHFQNL